MKKPCQECSDKGFECTFEIGRKKRGPTGKRIQEIRRAQKRSLDNGHGNVRVDQQEDSIRVDQQPNGMDLQRAFTNEPESASTTFSTTPYWSPNQGSNAQPTIEATLADLSSTGGRDELAQPETSLLVDPVLDGGPDLVFPSLPLDSPSSTWNPFGALLQQDLPTLTGPVDVWPSHINEETLLHWIDVYFKRLHTTIPILDRGEMYCQMLTRRHRTDAQFGSMLLALCAFAMTQPVQIHEHAETPSRAMQANMLLEGSVKM